MVKHDEACVNVLCNMMRGGGGLGGVWGDCKTWTKIRKQYVLSSATLIWQCDVINDEKRMNMINRDGNDESM